MDAWFTSVCTVGGQSWVSPNGRTDVGVAVALVDGRVGGKEIEVLVPLWVPDVGALSSFKAAVKLGLVGTVVCRTYTGSG